MCPFEPTNPLCLKKQSLLRHQEYHHSAGLENVLADIIATGGSKEGKPKQILMVHFIITSMARLTPYSLQSKREVTWLMFLGKKRFKTDLL